MRYLASIGLNLGPFPLCLVTAVSSGPGLGFLGAGDAIAFVNEGCDLLLLLDAAPPCE